MPFSESVKSQAFARARGWCECKRQGHGHIGRCATTVTRATAQFHHVHAQALGGHDGLSNCEVLCRPCHVATPSYGKH